VEGGTQVKEKTISVKSHLVKPYNVALLTRSILMAIFPGEPGLDGFIGAKDNRSGGDNWSYKTCKAPVKSKTNNQPSPSFLQVGCPSCHPTKYHHSLLNIT